MIVACPRLTGSRSTPSKASLALISPNAACWRMARLKTTAAGGSWISTAVSREMAVGFLRYLAGQPHLQEICIFWRPFLKDPNDDMVLELAVASHSSVTVEIPE